MKPIIVIIDDDDTHVGSIRKIFKNKGYDFYPTTDDCDKDFFEYVKKSVDYSINGIGDKKRQEAVQIVTNRLKNINHKVAAYIIDYSLKEHTDLTGLCFYQTIIKEIAPSKSAFMLTHLTDKKKLNMIIDAVDEINDKRKFTFRMKDLNDTGFQNGLINFVKQANPILQLIDIIKQKPIRNRIDTLNQCLDDIKTNYTKYKDDIITVLTDFANRISTIDEPKQTAFINECNNCILSN
jgi:hypothetical protein